MDKLLAYDLLNNPAERWIVALVITVTSGVALLAVRRGLRGRVGKLLTSLPGRYDDILVQTISATRAWFLWLTSLYVASHWLRLPDLTEQRIDRAYLVLALLQAGLWAQRAVRRGVETWAPAEEKGETGTAGAALKFIASLTIWSVVLLVALQNLGIEIGGLLAGLGVGGVAAALALQTVLGDLFASLSIYLDRPFDLGDFIIVGDFMGTVDKIGLRTTRLVSLGGEQLVLPNGELVKSRVRNYRRMQERRVVNRIGVEYGTAYEKVRQIPGMLEEIITSVDNVRFDRAHFATYGDSSLVFELVFYVLSADYNQFMDRQQRVNLEILRRFEQAQISFAFPSRTLYLRSPAPEGVGRGDGMSREATA